MKERITGFVGYLASGVGAVAAHIVIFLAVLPAMQDEVISHPNAVTLELSLVEFQPAPRAVDPPEAPAVESETTIPTPNTAVHEDTTPAPTDIASRSDSMPDAPSADVGPVEEPDNKNTEPVVEAAIRHQPDDLPAHPDKTKVEPDSGQTSPLDLEANPTVPTTVQAALLPSEVVNETLTAEQINPPTKTAVARQATPFIALPVRNLKRKTGSRNSTSNRSVTARKATRWQRRTSSVRKGTRSKSRAKKNRKKSAPTSRTSRSQSTAPTSREVSRYWSRVRSRIAGRVPRNHTARGLVHVAVRVSRTGRLAAVRIIRRSGNAQLDRRALSAVRSASPFPRPPSGMTASQFSRTVPIRFK